MGRRRSAATQRGVRLLGAAAREEAAAATSCGGGAPCGVGCRYGRRAGGAVGPCGGRVRRLRAGCRAARRGFFLPAAHAGHSAAVHAVARRERHFGPVWRGRQRPFSPSTPAADAASGSVVRPG